LSQNKNQPTNNNNKKTRVNNHPQAINRAVQGELAALERDLTQKLVLFYQNMIEFNVPIEFFKNSQALGFQVHSAIRKSVQDAYIIGIETVGNQVQRKVPSFELFLSVTDVETIRAISKEMFDKFWLTAERLLTRETATEEKDNVKIAKKAFDINSAIESLAAFIIFTGYNKAVTSKLQNVIANRQLGVGFSGAFSFSFSLRNIFKKIATKISDVFGDLLGLERIEGLQAQEMFLTKEDEKVDPKICEPFNRRTFDINDPDKPNPPLHRFCRCVLIPVVSDEPDLL
jgi:hypothetical protein